MSSFPGICLACPEGKPLGSCWGETSGSQCLILPKSPQRTPLQRQLHRALGQVRSGKPALRAYTSVTCFFYFCLPRGPVPSCVRDSDMEATHSPGGSCVDAVSWGLDLDLASSGVLPRSSVRLGNDRHFRLAGLRGRGMLGVPRSGEKGTEGPRGTPTGALLSATHF